LRPSSGNHFILLHVFGFTYSPVTNVHLVARETQTVIACVPIARSCKTEEPPSIDLVVACLDTITTMRLYNLTSYNTCLCENEKKVSTMQLHVYFL